MATISIYTFAQNALFYDFHIVEMLRHHLPLADEIVINEGYSTDGTYEAITQIDPKIKVFRSKWGRAKGIDWYPRFKNEARLRCTGDWCILLDCDEFIPEWEFEPLRAHLDATDADLVPLNFLNFYGNYRVYHARPRKHNMAAQNVRIHRNLPDIGVWGDGANVRSEDPARERRCSAEAFSCHHFSAVRHPARLRQKFRRQGRLYLGKGDLIYRLSFLFNLMPYKWMDPQFLDDLAIYEGPYCRAVRENPSEFVRDNFEVYEYLKRRERVPV